MWLHILYGSERVSDYSFLGDKICMVYRSAGRQVFGTNGPATTGGFSSKNAILKLAD